MHEAVADAERKSAQEHPVDHTENGRARGDAERDRDHRREGEGRGVAQGAECITSIVEHTSSWGMRPRSARSMFECVHAPGRCSTVLTLLETSSHKWLTDEIETSAIMPRRYTETALEGATKGIVTRVADGPRDRLDRRAARREPTTRFGEPHFLHE